MFLTFDREAVFFLSVSIYPPSDCALPVLFIYLPLLSSVKRFSNYLTTSKSYILGITKFGCDQCGDRSFTARWSLTEHLISAHTVVPLACDQCPRKFKYFRDLRRHKENIHAPVSRPQCTRCEKYFDTCKLLRFHLKQGCVGKIDIPNTTVKPSQ